VTHRSNESENIMTAPILVTGGTGRLGRLVVPMLREAGRDVRVLSRSPKQTTGPVRYLAGDLVEGTGIAPAVKGVGTILHLAGAANAKGDEQGTRNLVQEASRAGVEHVVFISVIGADRVPLGYLRNKLAAEQVVAESGLPWTTVRAAQVHDLVLMMARGMAKLPVVPAPTGLRLQPVDAQEVAARLAELTLDKPAGRVADLAGPEEHTMKELIRSYLQAAGKHRLTVPMRIPGKAGRAYRAGDNLTLRNVSRGTRTWEDFLAAELGAAAAPAPRPA
jgi:uncharacterized protein YbjT (DUF2867 family)